MPGITSPMAWSTTFGAPDRLIEREIFAETKLSGTATRLRDAYARYACFANSIPTFRSREFVKIVKEAGLMSPTFNIRPPNRVDFVFTYACVHGPGGHRGKKSMSLEAFAYSTKGIAHELGIAHEEVAGLLRSRCPPPPPAAASTGTAASASGARCTREVRAASQRHGCR